MSDSWYPVGADMLARDLWTQAPLDWADADGEHIWVYARELVDARRVNEGIDKLPAVVYLQGGPGGKSPRPLGRDEFLRAALKRFRVVLADQRGTGRSTPLDGDDFAVLDPEESARRLSLHRADSIVQDFEAIRRTHFDNKPWWSIGQSYGGFLTLHYLSVAPEGLVASAITGGLPSIDPDPETVYVNTFPRVREKNRLFFERLPHLRSRVDRIADILATQNIRLADGDRLTVRRFQTLGLDFGMGVGFDRVHWLLDEAFLDKDETRLSPTLLAQVGSATDYASNPLFMALQESIYGPGPTEWAAQRERERHPEFSEDARPLLFTGEMAFPWMVEEIRALKGFAMGVNALASQRWPIEMYDLDRLRENTVPVEAVVYYDDMYVDAQLSLDTESRVGGLHAWVTNEYEHDGIRMGDVVERLFDRLEIRIAQQAQQGKTE